VREWRRLVKDEFDKAGIQLTQKGTREVRIVETSSQTEPLTPKTRLP